MSMHLAKAPADGLQVLKEGLARIYHGPGMGGTDVPAAAALIFPQAMGPIPLYTIGLDELLALQGLDAAHPIGWQYLLLNGSNVVRTADIYLSTNPGQHRFGSLTNAFAEGTEQAIAVAEQLNRVRDPSSSFELRSLRVPPLFITSLWLKGLNGLDDLFVVVPPAPKPLQPLVEFDTKTFLNALWTAARQRKGMVHATTGPAVGGAPTGLVVPPGPATS